MSGTEVVVKVVHDSAADIVTLVIAILGLVISVASASWQVWSRRLDDPRLRVQLLRGYLGNGGIISAPASAADSWQLMASQGYTERLLGVEVTNVGRFPISVENAIAQAEPSGVSFHRPGWHINPEQNHRLEPFSSASWWVDMPSIAAMVQAGAGTKPEWNQTQQVRMVVRASGGKSAKTKESLAVSPTGTFLEASRQRTRIGLRRSAAG